MPPFVYEDSINPVTNKKYELADRKHENINRTHPSKLRLEAKKRNVWSINNTKRELERRLGFIDANQFVNDNKNKFIIITSYSDNDGDGGSFMEHARIFRNLPHQTISHH